MPVKVDLDTCIGCETCVSVCPVESLQMGDDGKAHENPDTCIDCLVCVGSCPTSAISEME